MSAWPLRQFLTLGANLDVFSRHRFGVKARELATRHIGRGKWRAMGECLVHHGRLKGMPLASLDDEIEVVTIKTNDSTQTKGF